MTRRPSLFRMSALSRVGTKKLGMERKVLFVKCYTWFKQNCNKYCLITDLPFVVGFFNCHLYFCLKCTRLKRLLSNSPEKSLAKNSGSPEKERGENVKETDKF